PGAVARDSRGRFVARVRPALYGRKAEREAARAERAMLAPWRAGIKRARLIKRLLMNQKRAARDAARGEGERAAAARRAGADGGGGGGGWEGAGGSGGKTRTWPLATWCGGGGWGGSNWKTRQRPYAYGAPAGRWSRGSRGRDRRGSGPRARGAL